LRNGSGLRRKGLATGRERRWEREVEKKNKGEKYITNINFSKLQIQFCNQGFNTRTVCVCVCVCVYEYIYIYIYIYIYYFSGGASPLCFQ
jgi:hypothetical protein